MEAQSEQAISTVNVIQKTLLFKKHLGAAVNGLATALLATATDELGQRVGYPKSPFSWLWSIVQDVGDHGDDLFVRVKRWSCLPVKIVVCILVVDYALYERHGILLVLFLLLVFWAVLAELVFVAASGLLLLTVDRPQQVLVNILS